MTFDKLIENFPKILRALTLPRVFLACFLAGAFVMAYIVWDARKVVVDKILVATISSRSREAIQVGEKTKAEVKQLVDRSPFIVGIEIVSVNFPSSTRSTSHFYSDRIVLENIIASGLDGMVSPLPLFIEQDLTNNNRIIGLMAGRFICYDTKDTLMARVAPEFPNIAPYACSISIPPYEGNFAGYLSLLLTRVPDNGEVEQLRSSARLLAHSIFDRELSR